MKNESLDPDNAASYRINVWKQWDTTPRNDSVQEPQEDLPKGTNLPRKDWVTLYRAPLITHISMATTSSFVIPWGMSVVWHSPYWHLLEEGKVSLQYAHEMSHTNAWKEWDTNPQNDAVHEPQEDLPKGTNLPGKDWVTLSRARSKVGRTQKNLHRWGLAKTSKCPCGKRVQTMEHILRECNIGPTCSDIDLRDCSSDGMAWIECYNDKI